MGQAKHYMEDQEAKYAVAVEVAIQAGFLERCEIHDEVYNACGVDIDHAYRKGNTLISNKDPLVEIFNGNRRELRDILKEISTEYDEVCPLCERSRED